ncbi:MAG: PDZ domain-containing protein [Pirellulales bacterium]
MEDLGSAIKLLLEQQTAASKSAASTAPADTKKPAALKPISLSKDWLKEIPFRTIGPANMGGRITDIHVHEKDPSLWWIATASGGLLKTRNQGVTIEHQFDRESTVSIGAIATDPTNTDVLWVGTGEANPRNSVSYGDGVYKSTDGGKTWKNMGLKDTFQIGKIVVHPKNPDVVYVGALGRLYGENEARGVYRTKDGGKNWEKVLFVDARTGVIDIIMHPENPDIMIAALWDRLRDGFDSWPGNEPKPEGIDGYDPIRKWGPKGGLYKTTDGGDNWKKLTQGLPTSSTGRIGLDWQSGGNHTIYAIIDCEDIGKGPKPFDAFLGLVGKDQEGKAIVTQVFPESPALKAGMAVGDQLKKIDDQEVKQFDDLLEVLRKKKIGDAIALVVQRGEQTLLMDIKLSNRPGTNAAPSSVYMGITGEDREGKVVFSRITEGGPASKAGVKEGDIALEMDGKAVENYNALLASIRDKKEGDKIAFKLKRGEETISVSLTLENRPGQRPQTPAQSNVYMGLQGENNEGGGAKLTSITDDGPAAKAGLLSGDVVVKWDSEKIENYEGMVALIRAKKPGDKVKLEVKRGEATKQFEVEMGDRLSGSSQTRPYTYSYFGQSPNVQDQQGSQGYLYGGIYRSRDDGETWERVNSLNTRPMYFSLLRVDPMDDQRVYVLGVSYFRSKDGGVTFTSDFGKNVHADGHDLWIDPRDGRHMVIGCDGGFYVTFDYGDNWDHVNHAAVGQFYHVAISPKQPYWVFGGLQDNGSWGGPAISKTGGAVNEDWVSVSGGDGFVCRVDPQDPDLVYFESQNGAIGRRNLRTGERGSIRPPQQQGVTYRFNWNTPFILSNHNSKIFYSAGNHVFRSFDRGNDLRVISPEITLTKRGSATALSESPRNPNVLYVGTDDGALWVTKDGGNHWDEISKNLGLPRPTWIATIEASRFEEGRVYVCLDAHRSDDDRPYIFVSEDFGATFKPMHQNLPWGSTRCLREDLLNPNLLYLGTEFSFWVSVDRGLTWNSFQDRFPTVAVHEVAIHPTNGEIVLATHGRSLIAADVTGLRSLKPEHVETAVALHEPSKVQRWRNDPSRGGTNRKFVGENPSAGASLWYSNPKKAEKVAIQIYDIEGRMIQEIRGSEEPGLHRAVWNLTQSAGPRTGREGGPRGGAGGGPGGGAGGGPRRKSRSRIGTSRTERAAATEPSESRPADRPPRRSRRMNPMQVSGLHRDLKKVVRRVDEGVVQEAVVVVPALEGQEVVLRVEQVCRLGSEEVLGSVVIDPSPMERSVLYSWWMAKKLERGRSSWNAIPMCPTMVSLTSFTNFN